MAAWLTACAPGPGLVFEAPATGGWTGGIGGSTGATDAGEEEGATSSPGPPGPPGPPPSSATGTEESGGSGEESGAPDGLQPLLVPAQGAWRWHTGAAPAEDWRAPGFDDAAWATGMAPLVTGAPLTDTDGLVRVRRGFAVAGDPSGAPGLMLYVRRDDGAVIFLNGVELARSGMPLAPWAEGLAADGPATGSEAARYFRAVAPADALRAGENVVAAAVHGDAGDADRGFDLQLEVLDLTREPGDRMSVQVRTVSYGGEYGDDHVLAIWVERDGAFVRTLAVYGDERRDNLVRWNQAADGDTFDAVTGATRGRPQTHVVAWDLRDAAGQAAPPGAYTLWIEFTEDDSNSGAPPGPTKSVAFELGGGPKVVAVAADPRFRDWLVIAP